MLAEIKKGRKELADLQLVLQRTKKQTLQRD